MSHLNSVTSARMDTEDLKTQLVEAMLGVMDVSEKFQNMGTKEIDALVSAAINPTAKRTNPVVKKLYDLETTIGNLRGEFKKASLRAMISKEPECDDPKSVPSAPTNVIEPEVKPEVKTEEVETKTIAKSTGRPKKVKDDVKAEEPKVDAAKVEAAKVEAVKVEETKVDTKPAARAKKAKEPEPSSEEPKPDTKPTGRAKKTKDDVEVKTEEKKTETKPLTKEKKAKEEAPKEKKPESPPPAPVDDDLDEESEEAEEAKPLHVRRKNIPKHVKTLVWNLHMGVDKLESKCLSCRQEKVDARNFDCGHVIAEAKGGSMNISNLRPICRACNGSMGIKSMNEFTKEFFGWEV